MRNLRIRRVTVNDAVVEKVNHDGLWVIDSDIMPLRDCMAYNVANREEVTCYKVGQILDRVNGRRHLAQRIYAKDNNDAIRYFSDVVCERFPEGTLQLLTGDWKIIAARQGTDGVITIL